jgi:hypothetical protein
MKGADISSMLAPESNIKIGGRLGKVTRIIGPNRIFYETADGQESYVSVRGIGYVCDTEEEASALEALRDEASQKIHSFAATCQVPPDYRSAI